jgi:hypothetical protein
MSADKKERMRMRLMFAEQLAREIFAHEYRGFYPMSPEFMDQEVDKIVDVIYRVADRFIERQQKIVDEYELNVQPKVMPVMQAPPNLRGSG